MEPRKERKLKFKTELRRIKDQVKVTAEEMASHTQANPSTVRSWLAGRRLPMFWQDVVGIGRGLNLPIGEVNTLLAYLDQPTTIQELKKTPVGEADDALLNHWSSQRLNFPPEVFPFVGRAQEMSKIRTFLEPNAANEGSPNILNVVGPKGRGKTALIRHCLDQRYERRFSDGIVFLNDLSIQGIADALDPLSLIWSYAEQQLDLETKIKAHTRFENLLLIFEDVENFEQIASLIPHQPLAKIILTSEEPLRMSAGYSLLKLPPFTSLSASATNRDGENDVFQLFKYHHKNEWVETHKSDLLELARQANHSPQTLSFLAQKFKQFPLISPSYYLDLLTDPESDFYESSFADIWETNNKIAWEHFQSLPAHVRRFAFGLGYLPSYSFANDLAHKLTGSDEYLEQYLAPLKRGNLIVERGDRWEIYEPIKYLFRSQNHATETKEKILTYYVEYAEAYSSDFKALKAELENIEATIKMLIGSESRLTLSKRCYLAMSDYWLREGLFESGFILGEQIIRRADELNEAFDTEILTIQMQIGIVAYQNGDTATAIRLFQNLRSAEIVGKVPVFKARLLNNMATVLRDEISRHEIKSILSEGLAIALQEKIVWLAQLLFTNLSAAEYEEGNLENAVRYLHEGLALGEPKDGSFDGYCYLHLAKARFHLDRGEYPPAELAAFSAHTYAESFAKNLPLTIIAKGVIAEANLLKENVAVARKWIDMCLDQSAEIGFPPGLLNRTISGRLHLAEGRIDEAQAEFITTIDLAQEVASLFDELFAQLFLGDCYIQQGQLEAGQALWRSILKRTFTEKSSPYRLVAALAQYRLGRTLGRAGVPQVQEATDLFERFSYRELAEAQAWLREHQ